MAIRWWQSAAKTVRLTEWKYTLACRNTRRSGYGYHVPKSAKPTFYYNYILSPKPRRIIFNPGAENPELETLASEQGIQTLDACTLVMLGTGQY